MQIRKNATQEELEAAAGAYARKLYLDVMQMRLRAQLAIIFLCLVNPPSIFGFFMIGAIITAGFACFAGWAYSEGNMQLFHNTILWWFIWAATVYLINLILRALLCRKLSMHLKYYKDADLTDATPIPNPENHSIRWDKDDKGEHWQSLILFNAPQKGLYAFELVVEDYNGALDATPETPCAMHMEEIAGDRIRYVAIHRLEAGPHWLPFSLSNAEGKPPAASFCLLAGEG